MKAYQLTAWQQPPEFRDVEVPEPGPGQVLVKVGGAGACHSDLHLMEWPEGTFAWDLPFTLGHENAGWVEVLGAGVKGVEVGEAVAVYGPWGCGRCRACRLSRENFCERAAELRALGGGLGLNGGLAEYLLVPAARLLVPLGDLDPVDAAPLSDAALTPYHAVKRNLHKLAPGTAVVVIGVGGLGHMAVQLLRALSGARVVAVDIDDRRLEHARELGAELVVNSRDGADAAERIRAFTGARRAAFVLDCVGAQPTLDLAVQIVGRNSQLTVVGVGGGVIQLGQLTLPFGCSVCTPLWGTRAELQEVIALAQNGRIHVDAHYFGIAEGPRVLQELREGKIMGRAVLVPDLD